MAVIKNISTLCMPLLAALALSGCWSLNPVIHPNRLLDAGTKIEIIDASKDVLFNSVSAGDRKTTDAMIKRILELTREELDSMGLDAYTAPTSGAAKLKYEIRAVNSVHVITGSFFGKSSSDEFEVYYQVVFENQKGETIFVDTAKKSDSDLDGLCEDIAARTARNVANTFK